MRGRWFKAMNTMRKILGDAFLYWLQLVIYAWPAFLIGHNFFGLLATLILNHRNMFGSRLTSAVTGVILLCVFLFVFAYKRGYKKAEFHGIRLLISLVLAGGLQLIYASLFRFAMYTTAGAYYLAHLLYAGGNQEISIAYYDVPASLYIPAMLAADFFYIAAVMWGEYLGKKKRLQARAALNPDKTAEFSVPTNRN